MAATTPWTGGRTATIATAGTAPIRPLTASSRAGSREVPCRGGLGRTSTRLTCVVGRARCVGRISRPEWAHRLLSCVRLRLWRRDLLGAERDLHVEARRHAHQAVDG